MCDCAVCECRRVQGIIWGKLTHAHDDFIGLGIVRQFWSAWILDSDMSRVSLNYPNLGPPQPPCIIRLQTVIKLGMSLPGANLNGLSPTRHRFLRWCLQFRWGTPPKQGESLFTADIVMTSQVQKEAEWNRSFWTCDVIFKILIVYTLFEVVCFSKAKERFIQARHAFDMF